MTANRDDGIVGIVPYEDMIHVTLCPAKSRERRRSDMSLLSFKEKDRRVQQSCIVSDRGSPSASLKIHFSGTK